MQRRFLAAGVLAMFLALGGAAFARTRKSA